MNLVSDNGIITQGTSGIYEKGKVIDLSVTPNYGYIFSKWTSSNGGTFSDATSPTCTFTMPDKATTVTAEFIENPLIPKVSWNVASATNITQNNAQLNGVLRVLRSGFALSDFALPTVSELYCFASRSQAEVKSATASSHGAAYYVKYANPSYESDSDGRTYVRSIMTLSSMKNDAGAALNLQPGETCYFKWVAVVSNAPTSSAVNSFKLPAAPASWYQLESNTSQGMFSGRMRYSASQRMVEAGCFVSPDKTLVMNATHTNKNGTALKVDKAASGFEYGTIDNDRFTMVYYKAPPFDTIKTFAPGVTYYYKFYGITSSGDVAYSSISSYTPPATTTYALSVVAGIGGQIVAGNSGNYAAGNILSLIATPDEGYVFKGWVATSGTLSNAASSSSSFTVPASVSTVTAKFEPIEYTVNVLASGAGTVDAGSSGNYTVGSTVPLKATPDAGFRFVRWSSNAGGVFADAQSAVTTFTTPASNATIVAEFEEDVSSITFPQASYQIELGDTLALTAEILPEHRKDAALTWTSSDPTIASVDANGVVTMLTSGQAIIRAAAPNGVYGEVTIQSNIHIESVHVVVAERTGEIAEALVMRVGDTASFQTFTAPSTLPSGLTSVTTVNDALMKVDMAAGTVTALKPGIAYLSHTIYDSVNGQQHQLASGNSCMILIIDSTREFILPDTLTAIRSEAFANTSGTFIQIPDSVTDIGSKAFTAKGDLFILMDCSVKRIIAEDAFPENITYIIDTSGIYHVDAALEFDLNNWHYHFDGYLE